MRLPTPNPPHPTHSTMVSFNTIRDQFAIALASKPRKGLEMNEFNQIVSELIDHIEQADERHFMRLNYWLRQPDLDAQVVCSNVEFVRFGLMTARPEQKPKQSKSSGPQLDPNFEDIKQGKSSGSRLSLNSENTKRSLDSSLNLNSEDTLAHNYNVDRLLKRCRINPHEIKRTRSTVEARAAIIDIWVEQSVGSKETIDLPSQEIIADESHLKKPTTMKYISVRDLIDCIAESDNGTAIRSYAMRLMAAFRIYNEEWIKAKDRALDQKDSTIEDLNAKMDAMLAKADRILDQNDDLKTQNEVLIDTTDRMEKRQVSMAKDIKTMIDMFNNIGFTPNVVKQMIELHGGANNNGSFRIDSDRPWQYVDSCKLFFMSSWYNENTRRLTMRVAARNFKTVSTYYKSIETEVQTEAHRFNHTLTYHGTQVIALCDREVNAELSTFDPIMRRNGARKVGGKVKKFEAAAFPSDAVETYLAGLTTELRNAFCMRHQSGIRKLLEDTTLDDEQRAQVVAVRDQHTTFNTTAIEWCQMYVSACVDHLRNGMRFRDRRLTFPKMTGMARTHQVDGTDWSSMTPLQYAMTMFKICVRDFSRNEYIREIISNDLATDALKQ